MTESNPFAPPKAEVEQSPREGRESAATPWWVARRDFSAAVDHPAHVCEHGNQTLPAGTAIWITLLLYALTVAGLRGHVLAQPWSRPMLPIAGIKLFFPTTNIEIILLFALAALGVRQWWRRRTAIRSNPHLLRSSANRLRPLELLVEQVGLGGSIAWRLLVVTVLITYVAPQLRDAKAAAEFSFAGTLMLVPLAILFMRQGVGRLYGASRTIATWRFLWRAALVTAITYGLEIEYQAVVFAVRGTIDLTLAEWGLLFSAVMALKCLGFGWAAIRAVGQ